MLGPTYFSQSTNFTTSLISDCQLLLSHSTDINSPLYPWLEYNEHHRISILEFSKLLDKHLKQHYSNQIDTIKALIAHNINLLASNGQRKYVRIFLEEHPHIAKFYSNNLEKIQYAAKDYQIYNMSLQISLNLSIADPVYNDCLAFYNELQESLTEEQALRRVENGSIPPNLNQYLLFRICQKKEFHRLSNELDQRYENQEQNMHLAKQMLCNLYLPPKPK